MFVNTNEKLLIVDSPLSPEAPISKLVPNHVSRTPRGVDPKHDQNSIIITLCGVSAYRAFKFNYKIALPKMAAPSEKTLFKGITCDARGHIFSHGHVPSLRNYRFFTNAQHFQLIHTKPNSIPMAEP